MSLNTSKRPFTPEPYPPSPSPRTPFGQDTLKFFVEGEQHEAAKWQDAALPPDDEPEPSLRSGSFDKIPRNRSATITLVVLAACLMFGIVMGARFFLNTGREVDAAKAAYSQTPPGNTLPEGSPQALAGTPGDQATPLLAGKAVTEPAEAVAEPANPPAAELEGASATAKEPAAEPAPAQMQRPSRAQAQKTRALRNYVWSPTAQALVPVDDVSASAAIPTTVEDVGNSAAPFQPPANKIEPANTGAPPAERAAPAAESQ